jgi:lipoprotein-releasing system ATP-binding protein
MHKRMEHHSALACTNLSKEYQEGTHQIPVLQGVNLSVAPGEQIAIMGRSGSGKTTLLQLLGGLDQPSSGAVFLKGQNLSTLTEAQIETLRNQSLGFVYQSHHLLAEFSAIENVAMPLLIGRQPIALAKAHAIECLMAVGLQHRLQHRPAQLSGGERQRVAIARALVNRPDCVLADEPTGNLDDESAMQVFEILQSLNRTHKTSLIIVTHDPALAAKMDRIVTLHNGCLST